MRKKKTKDSLYKQILCDEKTDIGKARRFRNTFRFIDDLLAINDDGEFEKCIKEIYPSELELKKEHGDDSVTFLDLQIDLKEKRFVTSLFDKRDSFPFSIVRMPFKCSNIPSKIFYSSIGAEILRISRTSMTLEAFVSSSKSLLNRMLRQGANSKRIGRTLRKMYNKHIVLRNFGENVKIFLSNVL